MGWFRPARAGIFDRLPIFKGQVYQKFPTPRMDSWTGPPGPGSSVEGDAMDVIHRAGG